MPSLAESLATQSTQMGADNKAGVDAISYFQEIEFVLYRQVVLPLDGYVFWVKADLLAYGATPNRAAPGRVPANEAVAVVEKAKTLTVKGSLHYATDTRQEEQENYGLNRVVFTAEEEVQDLNEIAPDEMYLGTIDEIQFAFTSRTSFYRQADLWHYVGDAVYPDMTTQVIDNPAQLDTRSLVVSNSLPIWLSMAGFVAPDYLEFSNPLKMYPSFLAPDNIRPPFATVHIPPESTEAIQSAPLLGKTLTHTQLATETVRVTIWGQRNSDAQNFADFVDQFSLTTDLIGIMNMPILRDEKRTQSELNTIAMKKTIEYKISYYQTAVRDIARQLIKSAIPTYVIQ